MSAVFGWAGGAGPERIYIDRRSLGSKPSKQSLFVVGSESDPMRKEKQG
jgi:hypothetical protein